MNFNGFTTPTTFVDRPSTFSPLSKLLQATCVCISESGCKANTPYCLQEDDNDDFPKLFKVFKKNYFFWSDMVKKNLFYLDIEKNGYNNNVHE